MVPGMSGEKQSDQQTPQDVPGLAHEAVAEAGHEGGKLAEATPEPVQNAAGAASDSAGSHVDQIATVAEGIADAAGALKDSVAGD